MHVAKTGCANLSCATENRLQAKRKLPFYWTLLRGEEMNALHEVSFAAPRTTRRSPQPVEYPRYHVLGTDASAASCPVTWTGGFTASLVAIGLARSEPSSG